MQPAQLIRTLIEKVDYEEHLKKTQQDWESRWENVQELITFASDVDVEERPDNDAETTPLRSLLETSMLSSEGDKQSEEENKDVSLTL
jgi:DNA helicase II / ATP-dependent DNA helicase PcrA